MLNADIKVKIFTYSGPLLETLRSTSQVAEKGLRNTMAYLKEYLKLGSVERYAWIQVKKTTGAAQAWEILYDSHMESNPIVYIVL